MKKIIQILKINILSLLALPLLIFSVFCKMVEKALEKIMLILGMLLLTFLLVAAFEFLKKPESIPGFIASVLVVLFVGGIFLFLLFWLLGILSAVAVAVWSAVLAFLNGLYSLSYRGYLFLSDTCTKTYDSICASGGSGANNAFCCFYLLLKGINRIIAGVLSLSLVLAFLLSAGLVAGSLFEMNHTVQAAFGIHLLTFIQRSQTYYVIYGIVIYLALMATAIVTLLSLGAEWYEWSKELKMTREEYNDYLAKIQAAPVFMEDSAASGTSAGGTSLDIAPQDIADMHTLEAHMQDSEELAREVEEALAIKEHAPLRSAWGEYLLSLSSLAETCSSHKQGVPVAEFKKITPRIHRLDKQRETIREYARQIRKEFASEKSASYFAGCSTMESLDKRYKDLCKVFHPDMSNGNEDTFKMIASEYEERKKSMSGQD